MKHDGTTVLPAGRIEENHSLKCFHSVMGALWFKLTAACHVPVSAFINPNFTHNVNIYLSTVRTISKYYLCENKEKDLDS